MKKNIFISLMIFSFVGLIFAKGGPLPRPGGEKDNATTASGTVLDVVSERLTTLMGYLQKAGLDSTLRDPESSFTLFGPTNEAFGRLNEATRAELNSNMTFLRSTLQRHVLSRAVGTADWENEELLTTMVDGQKIRLNKYDKTWTTDGKRVAVPNILATNGIAHIVDGVMLPVSKTIFESIQQRNDLRTLLKAVEAANLEETFSRQNQTFTLFAPSDDAFSKLDEETLKNLFNDTEKLSKVVLYHAVPSIYYSLGLRDGMEIETLEGSKLRVGIKDRILVGKDASVVRANLPQLNGVIHIVNKVFLDIPARDDDSKEGSAPMASFYALTFLFLILVSLF